MRLLYFSFIYCLHIVAVFSVMPKFELEFDDLPISSHFLESLTANKELEDPDPYKYIRQRFSKLFINHNPIVLGNTAGQQFACFIPDVDNVTTNSSTALSLTTEDINEAIQLQGVCLLHPTGWWSYEICIGKQITQYHEDSTAKADILKINLGEFSHETNWSNITTKPQSSELVYHSQWYVNGSNCEINESIKRSTEVRFMCGPNQAIAISEPSSCRYIITVMIPSLCTISIFQANDAKLTPLKCLPMLEDSRLRRILDIVEQSHSRHKATTIDKNSDSSASPTFESVDTLNERKQQKVEKEDPSQSSSDDVKLRKLKTKLKDLSDDFEDFNSPILGDASSKHDDQQFIPKEKVTSGSSSDALGEAKELKQNLFTFSNSVNDNLNEFLKDIEDMSDIMPEKFIETIRELVKLDEKMLLVQSRLQTALRDVEASLSETDRSEESIARLNQLSSSLISISKRLEDLMNEERNFINSKLSTAVDDLKVVQKKPDPPKKKVSPTIGFTRSTSQLELYKGLWISSKGPTIKIESFDGRNVVLGYKNNQKLAHLMNSQLRELGIDTNNLDKMEVKVIVSGSGSSIDDLLANNGAEVKLAFSNWMRGDLSHAAIKEQKRLKSLSESYHRNYFVNSRRKHSFTRGYSHF